MILNQKVIVCVLLSVHFNKAGHTVCFTASVLGLPCHGDSGTKFRRPSHQNVQNSVLSFSLYSYFHILVIGALLEYQPFSLFLRPHLVEYGDPAFIASMSSFVASRIQSDWLPSYLLCGPLNDRSICFGNLLVQSVVNTVCMILCLVPPDPCTIPQFLVVQINGISQTCILRTSRAKTNHFKHSQVRQTWVNSSFLILILPYISLSPRPQ